MSGELDLPQEKMELPLLPLRDVVVFPHMVIPLFVGRPKSIKALELAMESGKSILLVAQKSAAKDDPESGDLYEIGCISNILQMLKLPDGTVKVLVEGTQRARIARVDDRGALFVADVTPVLTDERGSHEVEAMRRAILAPLLAHLVDVADQDEADPRRRGAGAARKPGGKDCDHHIANDATKAVHGGCSCKCAWPD